MPAKSVSSVIPLPRAWPSCVKFAILHVISLAQFTVAHTRGWAADSVNSRIQLKAELDRALQDNALLREEIRIKDVRMARIPPHRHTLYPPTVVVHRALTNRLGGITRASNHPQGLPNLAGPPQWHRKHGARPDHRSQELPSMDVHYGIRHVSFLGQKLR